MIELLKITSLAGVLSTVGGVVLAQLGGHSSSIANQFPLIGGLVFVVVAFLGFLDRARRTIERNDERLANIIDKNSKVVGSNVEVMRQVTQQLGGCAANSNANDRLAMACEAQTRAITKMLEQIVEDRTK